MNRIYLASLLALFGSAVLAKDQPSADFTLALEAGIKQDSQLAVEEVDQYDSDSDQATHLQLEAAGQLNPVAELTLKGGYTHTSKSYQDNEQFDLDFARWYGDLSYDFSWFTLGVNHHDIDAELAGDDFLEMTRDGIYLQKLLTNGFFLRAESLEVDKTFDSLVERNASADQLSLDGFYFFNQGKTFFSVGFTDEDETAATDYYSYTGERWRATFSNKFTFLGKNNRLKLAWKYQNKDYQGLFPGIDQARRDEKNTFSLSWQFEFSDNFSLTSELEQTAAQSNFEVADYDATQLSLVFRAEL